MSKPDKYVIDISKTVSYYNIDSDEFNKIIKDVYNQDYEFEADLECNNDSSNVFQRIQKKKLDKYDTDKLDKFISEGTYSFMASRLLTDLCNRDLIPPGSYLISVCY